MDFRKAIKAAAKGRAAFIGPPGAGKTYTALEIAKHLANDARVLVIDTEHGSASKYADEFDFYTDTPETYAPTDLVKTLQAAQGQFDVIIVDSLSHYWMGSEGMLDQVNKQARAKKYASDFAAWKDVSPQEKALWDAMLSLDCHLIVTLRTKVEYVIDEVEIGNGRTKKVPRKVGLAPVQRQGLEYEFDIVADLDQDLNFVVTKSRCSALTGYVTTKAGSEFAGIFRKWLEGGEATPPKKAAAPPANGAAKATDQNAAERKALFERLVELCGDKVSAGNTLKAKGYANLREIPLQDLTDTVREMELLSQPEPEPEPEPAADGGDDLPFGDEPTEETVEF